MFKLHVLNRLSRENVDGKKSRSKTKPWGIPKFWCLAEEKEQLKETEKELRGR